MKRDLSYYRNYLLGYLVEEDDRRKDDSDFLDGRAEIAEQTFEDARRNGMTVDQAQELAMHVLMEDL